MTDRSLRGSTDLLDTIHAVSLIEDIDDFGPTILEEIDAILPSDLSSYNEVDPEGGRALVIGRPSQPSAASVEKWERWAFQNPCLSHMLRTGDGSARRISDFLTPDELHRLELYTEVYRPLGVENQLAVSLPAPAPLVLGIALNRTSVDFSDQEVRLLNLLRPHLVQAYRRLQLVRQQGETLESVSELLGAEGRAFHTIGQPLTGTAAELLNYYFGDCAPGLPSSVQKWLDEERSAFDQGRPGRLRQPLVGYREGRRLTLQYVPGGRTADLLWLTDQSTRSFGRVLERLGLSTREAEVLWRLTQGESTKSIALHAQISPLTVKKHLENVYRKLGVSGRTAAMALAFDTMTMSRDIGTG